MQNYAKLMIQNIQKHSVAHIFTSPTIQKKPFTIASHNLRILAFAARTDTSLAGGNLWVLQPPAAPLDQPATQGSDARLIAW